VARDEGFEARAVIGPRREGLSRLTLLVPLIALVGIAAAGFSGPRPEPLSAAIPDPAATAAPSPSASPRPQAPAQVLGLAVHRLGDLQPQRYGRDEVLAISGWYVPTAVTNCPPLPALYQDGKLPYLRGDSDKLAFCVRSGVLYAAPPTTDAGGTRSSPGLSAVDATVVVGVIMPIDLELTTADATEIVVLGRFVPPGNACEVAAGCRQGLIVDYLGWTPETPAT
jgi:hypothetical protein